MHKKTIILVLGFVASIVVQAAPVMDVDGDPRYAAKGIRVSIDAWATMTTRRVSADEVRAGRFVRIEVYGVDEVDRLAGLLAADSGSFSLANGAAYAEAPIAKLVFDLFDVASGALEATLISDGCVIADSSRGLAIALSEEARQWMQAVSLREVRCE